jgi:hypothetical protein
VKPRVIAFALIAGLAFGSTMVLAQTKGGGRHHKPAKPAKAADAGAANEAPKTEETAPLAATREREREEKEKVDGGVLESKTLDGGTRVFRFGEVEIEGRLRNPQLVYFLRRVRAEFAAGDLGHRTFMRELSETRDDPSF